MLTKIFNRAAHISPRLGRVIIRSWYQMLVILDREREMLIEEHIPLYVVPTQSRQAVAVPTAEPAKKTG